MAFDEVESRHERLRATSYAIIPAILCPMSFMLQFGYNVGTMNAATGPITRFFNASYVERYGEALSGQHLKLLWTIAKTGFPIGGAIGSFFVRPLMSRFGPRRSMFIAQLICITGAAIIALSKVMRSYEAFIVGNMILGMFCAVGEGVGPGYISDITIPRLRSIMGGLIAVALTSGLTFGNVLGLQEVLGSDSGWPFLLALNAVPSIIYLIYYKWTPDCPRDLFSRTHDEKKVFLLLTKLYGTNDVQHYIDGYKAQSNQQKTVMSVWQVLTSRSVRWQLLSAIVLVSSIQATGINGIMYNLNNLLYTAGINPVSVPYISIGVSVVQISSAVIAGFASRRFGRKTLFLFGNSLLSLSCVVYTFALAFVTPGSWVSYLAVVATVAFSVGLNAGSGVIAFVIAPEILTHSARPAGMGVAVFFFWIAFVIVSVATPYMFAGLKFGVLLPYLAVALLIMLFAYFVVPETKDKSSLEIEKFYEKRNNGCCNGGANYVNGDFLDGNTENSLETSKI